MPDQLSTLYSDLLEGSYDCVDRVVLNAYFGMGQTGGGLRVWWRELFGSDENLDDNHLMRMAGRFSRRLRAWAKNNDIPVIYCSPGEEKHKMAEQHLATHEVKPGLFMVLVCGRSIELHITSTARATTSPPRSVSAPTASIGSGVLKKFACTRPGQTCQRSCDFTSSSVTAKVAEDTCNA